MDHPTPRTFGEEVRAQRKTAGLTQAELAEAASYSQMAISKIERDEYLPPADGMQRIAAALGSPDALREAATNLHAGTERGLAVQKAMRKSRANKRRVESIRERERRLAERIEPAEESLNDVRERARTEFVEPCLAALRHITDWDLAQLRHEASSGEQSAPQQGFNADASRTQLVHDIGLAVTTTAAGAMTGAGAAATTYTAVGAFATASTGTAISTLSGAAASNATLAFLGGGSLASGGMGVAGGTMALAGIAAAPALLAGAVAVTVAGRRMLARATSDEERIDLAETKMLETERLADVLLPRLEQTKIALTLALQDRVPAGEREIDWLTREFTGGALPASSGERTETVPAATGVGPTVEWESLPPRTRERVVDVLQRLAVILQLTQLPVATVPTEAEFDDFAEPLDLVGRANDEILNSAFEWLHGQRRAS